MGTSAWGSKDSQVHVANNTGRPIYVVVMPNQTWAWADVGAMVAQEALVAAATTVASGGAGTPAAGAMVVKAATDLSRLAKLAKTIKGMYDAVVALRAVKVAMSAYDIASKVKMVADAAAATALQQNIAGITDKLASFLAKYAQKIPARDFKKVNDTSYSQVWNALNPSYWGAISGANTVTLLIIDESMEDACMFDTGADESWIVTPDFVVRSKYGTIWQSNPSAGRHPWSNSTPSVVIYADADYRGNCQILDPGNYNLDNIAMGNDKVSSLKVPAGFRVCLFEHKDFQGKSVEFTGDTSNVGSGYNDWASSITVSGPSETPPAPGVVIYQHTNFGGSSQVLAPGSYDMAQLTIGNDALSSLRVPSGYQVTLYEHSNFGGKSVTFSSDTSSVGDFNDKTSSIVVKGPDAQNVIIYQHTNYGGLSQSLKPGKYNLSSLGIGNDALSSIRIPSGRKVTLYEHADFKGATKVLTSDTTSVGDFNDKTSSIVVE